MPPPVFSAFEKDGLVKSLANLINVLTPSLQLLNPFSSCLRCGLGISRTPTRKDGHAGYTRYTLTTYRQQASSNTLSRSPNSNRRLVVIIHRFDKCDEIALSDSFVSGTLLKKISSLPRENRKKRGFY